MEGETATEGTGVTGRLETYVMDGHWRREGGREGDGGMLVLFTLITLLFMATSSTAAAAALFYDSRCI